MGELLYVISGGVCLALLFALVMVARDRFFQEHGRDERDDIW